MVVVAGPSGSGKSRVFPVQTRGCDYFNVDDRCAALNGGSYVGIPRKIRQQATRECEAFVFAHIRSGVSFAVETTLRTSIAIEQAETARRAGFRTEMIFVATGDVEENVRRVTERGLRGGHSAPADDVRETYRCSLANLPRAVRVFETVWVYDNSRRQSPADEEPGARPRRVAVFRGGKLVQEDHAPDWLRTSLPEVFATRDSHSR